MNSNTDDVLVWLVLLPYYTKMSMMLSGSSSYNAKRMNQVQGKLIMKTGQLILVR